MFGRGHGSSNEAVHNLGGEGPCGQGIGQKSCAAAYPFDLDSGGGGVGKDVEFFQPDADGNDARILQAKARDVLRQGLDQVDVWPRQQMAHALRHVFVADHFVDRVARGRTVVAHAELEVDANPLAAAFFVAVDAEVTAGDKIANEYPADSFGSGADPRLRAQGLDIGGVR